LRRRRLNDEDSTVRQVQNAGICPAEQGKV
jgi:hypothetical protein